MPNLSYIAHDVLMDWMRGIATPAPTQLFVGVLTSLPNQDGSNVVEPGGSYSRVQVTLSQPTHANGYSTFSNTTDILFPVASQDWPQVAWVGVFTQDNKLLFYGTMAQPRLIKTGDSLGFAQGQLQLRLR